MQFSSIYGQDDLKHKLIQSVQNGRISHAQLFLGAEGCGALPLAIAYAQYINCQNPSPSDSCGVCPSCIKFEKYIHPDLHFTFPTIAIDKKKTSNDFITEWRQALLDNPYMSELQWLMHLDEEGKKQGNITAEECRDVIRKVSLKSFEARYKTVIIWLPEYLKQEGNILLKLLEEPPPQTLFILVAQDADKVIGTILSRTQIVRIQPLSDAAITQALMDKCSLPTNEAHTIARVAEGNLALALALSTAGRSDYNQLFASWMRACYNRGMAPINQSIDSITGTGREFIKSFLGYSLHMLRSALLYRYAPQQLLRLSPEEHEFMGKFSFTMDDRNIPDLMKAINDASYHIERNADLRITFLNLSLYISHRLYKA